MRKFGIFALVISLFIGCDVVVPDNDLPSDDVIVSHNRIQIQSNAAALAERIVYRHQLLDFIPPAANLYSQSEDSQTMHIASDYTLAMIASVASPIISDTSLHATHIILSEERAYVSYNYKGVVYKGGVDAFDVSDSNNPILISQLLIEDSDISALAIDEDTIYLAGGHNRDFYPLNSPAILESFVLNADGTFTDSTNHADLIGGNAVDVLISDAGIYTATGADGGLQHLTSDLTVQHTADLADARSIVQDDAGIRAIQGIPRILTTWSAELVEIGQGVQIGADPSTIAEKMDMAVSDSFFGIPANTGGLYLYVADGVPEHFDLPDLPDASTNSVAIAGDLIFAASGAAGTRVYQYSAGGSTFLGTIDHGTSANFIAVQKSGDDYLIFVAAGTGGLQIILMEAN